MASYRETINTNCHILAASFQERSAVFKMTVFGALTHLLLHAHVQKRLHSVGPDVEAAGASLCSGVLSLHEAAADGKHGVRMGLESRHQLWPRRPKPEPHWPQCHRQPASSLWARVEGE